MSFSGFAGTAIVPTLGRVVLCCAFLSQGYNKVFNDAQFAGDDAQRLRELGVISFGDMAQDQASADVMTVAWTPPGTGRLAPPPPPSPEEVEAQDPLAESDDGPPSEGSELPVPPEDVEAAIDDAIDDAIDAGSDAVADPPVDTEPILSSSDVSYTAPAMHRVTLIVDGAGWPEPVLQARVLSFTELIGGGLLLIGLFSRVWGLGLAIAMGVAFYMTSWPMLVAAGPFELARMAEFTSVFTQLGLFVLAFGIFLTGPGPISFDRLLFHRKSNRIDSMEEL